MKSGIIFFIIFLSACSKSTNKAFLNQTEEQLIAQKGQPDSIKKSTTLIDVAFYTYGDEMFQLADSVITAVFRNPEGDEIFLQYWRKIYPKASFVRANIKETKADLVEYTIEEEKIKVLYDRGVDRVVRVVEFEE